MYINLQYFISVLLGVGFGLAVYRKSMIAKKDHSGSSSSSKEHEDVIALSNPEEESMCQLADIQICSSSPTATKSTDVDIASSRSTDILTLESLPLDAATLNASKQGK